MINVKQEIRRNVWQLMKTMRQEMINAGVDPITMLAEPQVDETDDGLVVHFLAPVVKPKRVQKRKVSEMLEEAADRVAESEVDDGSV